MSTARIEKTVVSGVFSLIRSRLLALHGDTVVHTGHGEDTTLAAEAGHVG